MRREPLRCGDGFAYDPATLLLHVAPEGSQPEPAFRCGYSHERFHWLQYQGTTIGMLLSLIRYSQERSVLRLFPALPPHMQHTFARERHSGRPIVSYDPATDDFDENARGGDIAFDKVWSDHVLVHHLLFDSDRQLHIEFPRQVYLAQVLADAQYALHELGLMRFAGWDSVRESYEVQDEIMFVPFDQNRLLTTRSVMESAAAMNEMLLAAYANTVFEPAAGLREYVAPLGAMWRQFMSSSYSDAWQYFCALTEFDKIPNANPIPSFLAVCDLALNPPVLPAATLRHTLWWTNLYPPLRFLRLAVAAREVGRGFDTSFYDEAEYQQYVEDLCEVAKVDLPQTFVIPYSSDSLELPDFGKLSTRGECEALDPRINYYVFLLWASRCMWNQRDTTPSLFSDMARFHHGDPQRILLWMREPTKRYLNAALKTDGRVFGVLDTAPALSEWLMWNNIPHSATYEFMCDTGEVILPEYPEQHRKRFSKHAMEALSAALGIEF